MSLEQRQEIYKRLENKPRTTGDPLSSPSLETNQISGTVQSEDEAVRSQAQSRYRNAIIRRYASRVNRPSL